MSARSAGLLWWLVVGGLAAAALFWQLRHPPRLPTIAGAAARGPELPAAPPLEPFKLPLPDQYAETATRPLFIAARRPEPPPPPDEASPLPPEKPPVGPEQKFLLLGVMITPQITVALLRPEEPNARTARIKPGETVGEWRLETVFPNRVVLRKGDATQELVLTRPKRPTGPRRVGAKPAQNPGPPASGSVVVPPPNALPASVVPPPPPQQ
ncbi:MAG: hypothetical protein JNK95_10575 [Candidatus Competibacter sp.]|nr:hypothetical protein [Candidatus Competibacter sp.]HRD48213.1 hypothetical protein [Candidatus Contendobacter sp.]